MFALLQDAMADGLMQEEWNKKAREQGITARQRLYGRELKDRKQCTNAVADGSSRTAAATSRVKEPLTLSSVTIHQG
jgi:hypothetical protein